MFREFFYLHKSDRRIFLSLLAVAAVAIGVIWIVGGEEQEGPPVPQPLPTTVSNDARAGSASRDSIVYSQSTHTPERFAFDPNTADSTQLLRLGLQPWMVRNVYRYREAGGIFRRKEDFARLYGLTVKEYRELEPYIRISADYQPASTLFPRRQPSDSSARGDTAFTPRYPVKLQEGETIDLATADTTLLRRVPGIGPFYARSIVEYRQRLGGFVNMAQLDEIEGFPQEAKDYFTLSSVPVEKLNVNTLTLNQLKRHPYLNFYQARAIVDYRRQYGHINSLNDLRLLPDFTEEAINRLLPYVEY